MEEYIDNSSFTINEFSFRYDSNSSKKLDSHLCSENNYDTDQERSFMQCKLVLIRDRTFEASSSRCLTTDKFQIVFPNVRAN